MSQGPNQDEFVSILPSRPVGLRKNRNRTSRTMAVGSEAYPPCQPPVAHHSCDKLQEAIAPQACQMLTQGVKTLALLNSGLCHLCHAATDDR
jgi:hypothetical protein